MGSATDTIGSLSVFTANTVIASADMNANFSVFRGHLLPISTSSAVGQSQTYDLGSSTYKWRAVHVDKIGGIRLLSSTSWTPQNNAASATTTGITLLGMTGPGGGIINVTVDRKTNETSACSVFDLYFVYSAYSGSWRLLDVVEHGDATGLDFTLSGTTIQYTSTNWSATSHTCGAFAFGRFAE